MRKNEGSMKILSRPEELILLAVLFLKDNAYGVTIRDHIIQKTAMNWTVGAVYVPLDRLAKAGFLQATIGEPTAERGGKRKKFYSLTSRGVRALASARRIHDTMWAHVSSLDWEPSKGAK
jgi:PadR family transcriptional regulator PadR